MYWPRGPLSSEIVMETEIAASAYGVISGEDRWTPISFRRLSSVVEANASLSSPEPPSAASLSSASWNSRAAVIAYLVLVIVVGVVGNGLSFAVYLRRYRPSSTRVFVLSMSACDLLTNLVAVPLQLASIRHAYSTHSETLCHALFAFATIPSQASGFYLILVAFDRYRRICKPFGRQLTPAETWGLVAAASVLAVLAFAPFTPLYIKYSAFDEPCRVTVHMCWVDDQVNKTEYSTAYKTAVAVSFSLGLAPIGFFYACIGLHVFRHRSEMKKVLRAVVTARGRFQPTGGEASAKVNARSKASSGSTRSHAHETGNSDPRALTAMSNVAWQESWVGRSSGERISLPSSASTFPDGCKGEDDVFSTAASGEVLGISATGSDRRSDGARDSNRRCSRRDVGLASSCSNRRGNSARTTLIMIVLTGLYVVNWLPHLVMRCLNTAPVNKCDNCTECSHDPYGLMLRSYYINSAVNAIVYCVCNPKFRRQCRLLLSKRPPVS